jgi:hypothetical protein
MCHEGAADSLLGQNPGEMTLAHDNDGFEVMGRHVAQHLLERRLDVREAGLRTEAFAHRHLVLNACGNVEGADEANDHPTIRYRQMMYSVLAHRPIGIIDVGCCVHGKRERRHCGGKQWFAAHLRSPGCIADVRRGYGDG